MRPFAALALVAAAALPARAQEPAPREPIPLADAQRRMLRGDANLRLHGLGLDFAHLERAVADYRTVVERMPEEADEDLRFSAPFALAFSLARADFPAEAEAREALVRETLDHLRAAAALNPEFPGLLVVEGMVREKTGDLPAAARLCSRGLAGLAGLEGLRPWQVYQLRLFGLLCRGRANLDPSLGGAHLSEKDFLEALALATEALRSPETPRGSRLRVEVLTHLAAALQRLDYYDRCEEVLRTLMDEDPGNFLHAYNLGLLMAQQQKFREAEDLYALAADLQPRDPRPHLKLAYILLKYPEGGGPPAVEEALERIEVYRSLTGRDTDEYCACRGEAAYRRGDLREAEAWFRRALEENPRCRQALSHLVRMLGREADPSPERKAELEDLLRRFNDLMRDEKGSDTMDRETPRTTFCRRCAPSRILPEAA